MRAGEVLGYAYAGLEGSDYMALRGPAGALYDLYRGRSGSSQPGRWPDAARRDTPAPLRSSGAPRVVLSTAEQRIGAAIVLASGISSRTMVEMTRELDA